MIDWNNGFQGWIKVFKDGLDRDTWVGEWDTYDNRLEGFDRSR